MKINYLFTTGTLCFFLAFGCRSVKKAAVPVVDIKMNNRNTPVSDTFLAGLLGQYPQYFDTLLKNNQQRRIQIIYTQIDRKKNNQPQFTHYYYNINPGQYFYPASTVKLPAAVLALQKLNELGIAGLDKHTTMVTGTGFSGQTPVYNDPTSADGRPTIAHYIKKILLVSDNDAFNRLYEFLGQEYLNRTLHQMGYDSVQILHRLSVPLSEEQNRHTNPVQFFDTATRLLYQQPVVKSNWEYEKRKNEMGTGYYSNGKLINAPFDFSKKNRLSLPDLHTMLQSILFPQSVSRKMRFNLTEDDYRFLYQHLSMYPRQSTHPQYDSTYNDAYVKFLLYGSKDQVQPAVKIFNKVGDAYGFLIDAAYIIDTEKKIEFMLSAVIHCNSDGIYNDDKYEYETVGFPFMKHLGQVIYDYELNRTRKETPDFTDFFK